MQRIDAELEALAVRLYGRLKSADKVAQRLQLGKTTIYRVLERHGIERPESGSDTAKERLFKLKGEKAAEVVKAYQDGMSMRSMCRKFGCSNVTIINAVRRAGGVIRKQGGINRVRRWTADEKQKICDLALNGWSQTNIALRFQSTQNTISRILIAAGVSTRPKHARLDRHGSWKGGRTTASGGYIGVLMDPNDPLFCMARSNRYVLEHRIVMARSLGRPLDKNESVHHINGDRTDNRPENLQLRHGKHGAGTVPRCADCGSHNIIGGRIADA